MMELIKNRASIERLEEFAKERVDKVIADNDTDLKAIYLQGLMDGYKIFSGRAK